MSHSIWKSLLLGLSLVLLCTFPTLVHATVDWDESFEYSGSTVNDMNNSMDAVWSTSCPGNSGIIAPTTQALGGPNAPPPRSGSKMLRETFRGHQAGNGEPATPGYQSCYKDRNLGGVSSTLYARWWVFIPGNFQMALPTTKSTLHPAYAFDSYTSIWWVWPWQSDTLTAALQRNYGDFGEMIYGGTTPRNQWVCVQTRMTFATPGTNNGIIVQKINGVTYINRTNVQMDQVGQQSFHRAVRLYTQDGIGDMFYDDYAVSRDAEVTCDGSAPPAPDTTPPPVPQAPTVTAQTLPLVVNWVSVANPGDLAGYKYYRKLEVCTGATAMTMIATLGNALTYTDTTIANSATNVCVKISSYDTSGNESSLSPGRDVSLTPPASSVRTTTMQDTFTNVNINPLPFPWLGGYTNEYDLQLLSNKALSTVNVPDATMIRDETTPNDQWMCALFAPLGPNGHPGLLLRMSNPPVKNGYDFRIIEGGTAVRLGRWDNYIFTSLGHIATSLSNTVQLCGEAEGTALRLYTVENGVSTLRLSATDATYATGKRGLITSTSNPNALLNETMYDSVTGGSFTTGTPASNTFSLLTALSVDATGANLTFNGLAHKIRYWNDLHPQTAPVEVIGLGGVSTYRLVKTWEVTPEAVTFVCFESQGSDGIWESDKVTGSYICGKPPVSTTDTTAPAIPSGLMVR